MARNRIIQTIFFILPALSVWAGDNTNPFFAAATIAREANCFITIESAPLPKEHWQSWGAEIPRQPRRAQGWAVSSDRVKEELEKAVGDYFAILPDNSNPKVIHLIDKQLLDWKQNPLDQKVTLKFEGDLQTLANRLQGIVPGITRPAGEMSDSIMRHQDAITKVTIDVNNEIVRDMLTRAAPLERRWIVWVAETHERQGKKVTEIRYIWPGIWGK